MALAGWAAVFALLGLVFDQERHGARRRARAARRRLSRAFVEERLRRAGAHGMTLDQLLAAWLYSDAVGIGSPDVIAALGALTAEGVISCEDRVYRALR